ncbi:MAG: biopolymer transporter ExbD [Gemmatimonadaceae bacterium]
MTRGASGGIASEPNVIPMIDVMLVLIVTFMLLITVRLAYDLQVPLPTTAGQGVQIIVSVDSGPTYSINGIAVERRDLLPRLSDVLRGRSDRSLFVRGARTVKYKDVVAVFDAARGAGAVVTGIVPTEGASTNARGVANSARRNAPRTPGGETATLNPPVRR